MPRSHCGTNIPQRKLIPSPITLESMFNTFFDTEKVLINNVMATHIMKNIKLLRIQSNPALLNRKLNPASIPQSIKKSNHITSPQMMQPKVN